MPIPVSTLINSAADLFGVDAEAILGPRRFPEIFAARAAVCVAAKAAGRNRSEIGRALGGRDPGSIRNAISRAEEIAASDHEFRAACAVLTAQAHAWLLAHIQQLLDRHVVRAIKAEARGAA